MFTRSFVTRLEERIARAINDTIEEGILLGDAPEESITFTSYDGASDEELRLQAELPFVVRLRGPLLKLMRETSTSRDPKYNGTAND